MDISERIRLVRKWLKLSQTAFGAPLGASRNSINDVENDRAKPSNMLITAICREYNVNEIWLRAGEGEMIKERTREEDIAAFLGGILGGKCTDFQRAFLTVMARMTPQEWLILEAKLNEIHDEMKNAD